MDACIEVDQASNYSVFRETGWRWEGCSGTIGLAAKEADMLCRRISSVTMNQDKTSERFTS